MKASIKRLKPYVPEKPLATLQAELGVAKLVRLSANENPYGTSPAVAEAVKNWDFAQSNRYPDAEAAVLRQAVAAQQQIDPASIVFSVGLDEMIVMLSRTFLAPADQVLVSTPTFSEYGLHAEIEGAKLVSVPTLSNDHVYFTSLLRAITPQVKMVWLCNPNNPTGTVESLASIEAFIQQVPTDTMVLIDEAYIDFVPAASQVTAMQLPAKYANVAVMRTFSKAYGLANFRVGYAVFNLQYASAMQTIRLPYNVNSLAQVAALAAINDADFVQTIVQKNATERTKWLTFLDEQGLTYDQSGANFIFFNYPAADRLADYLRQHGYLIRAGLRPGWLRVTIGTADDNRQVQQLMREFKA